MSFGWDTPLVVADRPIELTDYPRYGNVFVEAEFPGDRINIHHQDAWLRLDYQKGTLTFSGLVQEQA